MDRISWDDYFLVIAKAVSTRSTCPRSSIGVVLVKDKHILSTGYNGAPQGKDHCTDVGCIVIDEHCQRAIHAETNAIAQALKFGINCQGATLYLHSIDKVVCRECAKLLIASEVIDVVSSTLGVGWHEEIVWPESVMR